jgi:hydroxymethylglutaryl-CoA reductase (NADPH)
MRTLFRPLAVYSAFAPIESIVFFSVIGTLAYFNILSAIKHSAFFAPSLPSSLSPAYALLHANDWLSVPADYWRQAHSEGTYQPLDLHQLIFSLDPLSHELTTVQSSETLSTHQASLSNFTNHLLESVGKPCYPSSINSSCFTHVSPLSLRSTAYALALGQDVDVASLVKSLSSTDSHGVKFSLDTSNVEESIGEMKSGKWIAYALRALVIRFSDLARQADSLDILLVLAGYILMHLTFIRLFLASRALGSNFWLSTGVLSSAVLAFMLSMPIVRLLSIPLDPVALTEALPFLVCTVGFDKPLRLARAVFSHPALLPPPAPAARRTALKPAGEIILDALDRAGNTILRDYALEIGVLLVGANTRVSGLKEFCALAALMVAMDCLVMATFYTAILSIMVEVSILAFLLCLIT